MHTNESRAFGAPYSGSVDRSYGANLPCGHSAGEPSCSRVRAAGRHPLEVGGLNLARRETRSPFKLPAQDSTHAGSSVSPMHTHAGTHELSGGSASSAPNESARAAYASSSLLHASYRGVISSRRSGTRPTSL